VDVRGRWAALFADLEGELDAADAADLDDEVTDRAGYEVARLTLTDRLTAAEGRAVTVTVTGAGPVRGTLTDSAPGWLVVGDALVPTTAVQAIAGLPAHAAQPGPVRRRLTLTYALRAIASQRGPVALTTIDGRTSHGTIDRVGADFVDVTTERGPSTIPYAVIATVRPG
jgi:hypothetical protein